MDFKLEQDMRSIPKAEKLGLDIDPSVVEEVDIPVFYAEGLEVSIIFVDEITKGYVL